MRRSRKRAHRKRGAGGVTATGAVVKGGGTRDRRDLLNECRFSRSSLSSPLQEVHLAAYHDDREVHQAELFMMQLWLYLTIAAVCVCCCLQLLP